MNLRNPFSLFCVCSKLLTLSATIRRFIMFRSSYNATPNQKLSEYELRMDWSTRSARFPCTTHVVRTNLLISKKTRCVICEYRSNLRCWVEEKLSFSVSRLGDKTLCDSINQISYVTSFRGQYEKRLCRMYRLSLV